MNDKAYRDSIQALAILAHSLGENGRKQNALINAIHEIEMNDRNSMHNKERIKSIVGMFYDGLAYGNWPWIVNGIDTLPNKG